MTRPKEEDHAPPALIGPQANHDTQPHPQGLDATRADALRLSTLPGVGKVLGPGEIPAKHPFPRNSGQAPK